MNAGKARRGSGKIAWHAKCMLSIDDACRQWLQMCTSTMTAGDTGGQATPRSRMMSSGQILGMASTFATMISWLFQILSWACHSLSRLCDVCAEYPEPSKELSQRTAAGRLSNTYIIAAAAWGCLSSGPFGIRFLLIT